MNCHEIDELAAAYTLSALSPDEREAVDAHLVTCDAHAHTFAQLESAAALLPLSVYEIEPHPRLRGAISRAVRAETPAVRPQVQPQPRRTQPLWGFFQRGFAMTAVVLMLSLFGFGAYQAFFAPTESDIFERNLSDTNGASAKIVYFESHELAIVHTEGLAPLADGQTYQLWSVADGQPVNRGVLTNLEPGSGVAVIFGDIPRKEPCFVTIEPDALSQRPTGRTVLTTMSEKQ